MKLTVNGKSYTQLLQIKLDPRVKTPPLGIRKMFDVSMNCYQGIAAARTAQAEIAAFQPASDELKARAMQLAGQAGGGRRRRGASSGKTFSSIADSLLAVMQLLEGADVEPTSQASGAAAVLGQDLKQLLASWDSIRAGK